MDTLLRSVNEGNTPGQSSHIGNLCQSDMLTVLVVFSFQIGCHHYFTWLTRMAISKTLVYKTAEFHGDGTTRTLQSMVQSALKKLDKALLRRQDVDGSENSHRLVNYHSPYEGLRVGELLEYTAGDKQPFATIDKKPPS